MNDERLRGEAQSSAQELNARLLAIIQDSVNKLESPDLCFHLLICATLACFRGTIDMLQHSSGGAITEEAATQIVLTTVTEVVTANANNEKIDSDEFSAKLNNLAGDGSMPFKELSGTRARKLN